MKHSIIYAQYNANSIWDLEFNIEDVDDWYVIWNTLHVRHKANEEYVRYSPVISAEDDIEAFKRARRTDYELVEEGQLPSQV